MTAPALTYVELFAGAGGLSLGLEAAGFHPIAHCEIEPNARAVLRYRWPNVRLDGDVTQVNGADFKGVTLISGGSPCQDLSVAGKRKGLAGERSGLFYEQVRIWKESEAAYLIWENVLGALSSNNGRDFGTVLSTLVGAALPVPSDGWRGGGVAAGPDAVAAWRVLDLQHFGPPQRRVRVFIVAARTGGVDPAEVLALSEGVCGHPSPREQSRQRAATGIRTGAPRSSGLTIGIDGEKNAREELMGTLPARAKSGGIRQSVVSFAENQQAQVRVSDVTAQLTTGGGKPGQGYPAVLAFESTGGSWGVNEGDTAPPIKIGTGLEIASPPAVVAFPIDTRNATRTTDQSEQNRQGVGIGVDGDPSPTLTSLFIPAVVAINGTDVTVTACARDAKSTNNDVVGALDFGGHGGSYNGQDAYQGRIRAEAGRPRRLTPLECERLMSWPDQWTATGLKEDGTEYALSDTARYRLCGNGVGSVCVAWFAHRLAQAIAKQHSPLSEGAA